ncbi:MAG: glycosyltransferase [Candidatus Eremiobacteraeota bacterium]|nr:glycosyltransferase [Candidatus Eremiobacteraeota bacterium]
MNILLWHVHGSWTTAFVQGEHRYFVPVIQDRGPDGRGRAQTWEWPQSVIELPPERLAHQQIDVLIVQRPHELTDLAPRWLAREPGRDVPTIYVEHDAPQGEVLDMVHCAANRPELIVVHVTHFNDLFWNMGSTPTRVIEHGVVDPGYRYTGEMNRSAIVINEPSRRGRVTGSDLIDRFAQVAPVDLFGISAAICGGIENLPQAQLHSEMAKRRLYIHPIRWTSLGLSLIEAMHLGMPVIALATTEVPKAVPSEAGFISTDISELLEYTRMLITHPKQARSMGQAAREAALARYGLPQFLRNWNALLAEVAA